MYLRFCLGGGKKASKVDIESMSITSIAKEISINNSVFILQKERRNGSRMYQSSDKQRYLRIGSELEIAAEQALQKELQQTGFPVARILEEGFLHTEFYWIEESLGRSFGEIFEEECQKLGKIQDGSFERFLQVASKYIQAQQRTVEERPISEEELASKVGFKALLEELPAEKELLLAGWNKLCAQVELLPTCFTHGDFLPNNILERGVIDFEDSFYGPISYDFMNPITTAFWFPYAPGSDFARKSWYANAQIDRYQQMINEVYGNDSFTKGDVFDSNFLLKATWWTKYNGWTPANLQAWRYETYKELMRLYIRGESLYEYWYKHKDD